MKPKPIWQSKTFWMSVIVAATSVCNDLLKQPFIPPQYVHFLTEATALLAVAMRFLTTQPTYLHVGAAIVPVPQVTIQTASPQSFVSVQPPVAVTVQQPVSAGANQVGAPIPSLNVPITTSQPTAK